MTIFSEEVLAHKSPRKAIAVDAAAAMYQEGHIFCTSCIATYVVLAFNP